MYSKEQREHALEVHRCRGSVDRTVDEIGYPSEKTLCRWAANGCCKKAQRKPNAYLSIEERGRVCIVKLSPTKSAL